ncbi:MAG: peptidoglycan-binding protein [Calothrix sp. CSU_2_0]|nr:peptidoglycan-binding protein [Calothrix sp. CSU_2_0]
MSTATFTRLQEGSTGSAVTKLQQRLKTLKFYTGAVDGVFGANTKAAVIKYQQSKAVQFNDVTVDGIVGYVTEAAIQRDIWLSQRQTVQQGSQGKDVQLLQQILKMADDINKNQGPIWNVPGGFGVGSVDSAFGAKTKAAVIKFQQASKLKADGVVGAATWDRLAGIVAFDLDASGVVENNVYDLA